MAEASIRAASKVQGDRMLREQLRVQNKRQNSQTTNHPESSTTATNKRHKPDNGAPNQPQPTGQAQEKKRSREERSCPYCKIMPGPHRVRSMSQDGFESGQAG
ncbi:hypothetical protein SARC_02284 [Sphaeroforma arctica JP610]|uniref:Uncharacterized protein n=1 Tax=Sphaeroforma arctica JP610 TaxID=667725 RepID=A0A0L0GB91_9EUKA|nr:hypothetical protein SARC_02284 [Sphaeroforma arctica JP610]KNC85523.1 hypothetical protein SARC_02284 [Sphaeroforma arctica JP610]|eukprot:XP_014159425.1 hypothetical protein SARC_02284 [Sphaeroforma arctica JP610]